MSTKRVTSIDVAQAAGVSQSTVSRTFSGGIVSADKRKRVLDAAAELQYSPNRIARSLITRRTNIIGFVAARFSSPFNAYMMQIFASRLQAIGYQLLVFTVEKDADVDELLPQVLQYRVDALIITAASLSSEMADICATTNTPVVLFNRTASTTNANTIACDNRDGGRQAAKLLLDAGHSRLAYIAGPQYTSTSIEREAGYVQEIEARQTRLFGRAESAHSYDSGYDAARQLLGSPARPDAIFCSSDVIALSVIDCAKDMGLNVPKELSVIGFDDIPEAAWSAYSLTTLRLPVNTMISATITLIERMIETPTKSETQIFPPALVRRGSA